MKFLSIAATLVAAVSFATLTACGGGGGGSASAVAPSVQTCPDGTAVPAAGTASCPVVVLGAVTFAANNAGVGVPLSGTLDAASVTSTGITLVNDAAPIAPISGVVSLANKVVQFVPTVRLAYSQSYTLTVNATDSVGRTVKLSQKFSTPAMACADNTIWSNPATFVAVHQDCVAPVGVQTLLTQINVRQDNSCVMTVGSPMSAACRAYMANGTIALAETSATVNGHSAMWAVFHKDGATSTIALLDVSNAAQPVPVATIDTTSPLSWMIGNSGLTVAMGTAKSLVTLANNQLMLTPL